MSKLVLVVALFLAACGGGSNGGGGVSVPPNADISGQYPILLTTTQNTIPSLSSIQTNFIKQSDGVFKGDPDTYFCPGGLLSCSGNTPLTAQVRLNSVSIAVSPPGISGQKTITLTGTVSGSTMSGTYKDTDGDAGTWTATHVSPLTGTYIGTATDDGVSTIPLGVALMLVQQSDFSLTGGASITNSPCITQLNFTTGKAVGGSFYVDNSLIFMRGVPASGNTYAFLFHNIGSPGPVGICENYQGGGDLTRQ
jgi:hypothetical protein